MKKLLLIIAALALAGCGTTKYSLGYVNQQEGKTPDQLQLDTLICKDEAQLATRTPARAAGEVLAGATIIGIPFAMGSQMVRTREAFAQCMAVKGYKVTPA